MTVCIWTHMHKETNRQSRTAVLSLDDHELMLKVSHLINKLNIDLWSFEIENSEAEEYV